jgi:hypothetical protein
VLPPPPPPAVEVIDEKTEGFPLPPATRKVLVPDPPPPTVIGYGVADTVILFPGVG